MEQKRLLEAQVETLGRQVTALQEQRDAQERELRRLHASRTGASPSDGSDSATPATTPAHSVPPASGNRSVVRTLPREPVLVRSIRILIAPSLFLLPPIPSSCARPFSLFCLLQLLRKQSPTATNCFACAAFPRCLGP